MKSKFTRLTLEERKVIEKLLRDGLSSSFISNHLGRGKNCINLEVRRAGGRDHYEAVEAQSLSDKRHSRKIHSQDTSRNNYIQKMTPLVLKLHEKKLSFFQIRRELQISYISLLKIFKDQNLDAQNAFTLISLLEDRLYALEQQVEVLFEITKGKNGKNY